MKNINIGLLIFELGVILSKGKKPYFKEKEKIATLFFGLC
jgi:hypothetical protein